MSKKKKIAIVLIIALVVAGIMKIIVPDFYQKKQLVNKEILTTNMKESVNKNHKELDREYVKEISPYLYDISIQWFRATARLFTINEECSKRTMLSAFQNIEDKWGNIFQSGNKETKNIKKLKEKLSDVYCLEKSAITDISSAIFSGKEDSIKEGNKKLGDAIKKMEDVNRLMDKMKE